MPFNLSNSTSVFQVLISDVLSDFLNIFVFIYLDDILIYSRNIENHRRHIRLILQSLLENRLFVKAEKCTFHKTISSSFPFLATFLRAGRFDWIQEG